MQISKPKKGYKLVTNFFKQPFEIPEDWEYPKFDKVVKTNSLTKLDEDIVPYIPMDAVDVSKPHFNYFEERTLSENSSLTKFQENDVLFARITPSTENGKTCIVENFSRKGITSSELTVLRPTKLVFPRYLYYFVKNHRLRQFAISQMQGTTGRQRVPDYVFKKDLHFELPSLSEQQKISLFISNIDDILEKTNQLIQKTQLLKKGMMQQLFTKGIGHTKFKEIQFGLKWMKTNIPIEWEVKPLLEVAKFRQGLQIDKSKRYTIPGNNRIKLIKVLDFYEEKGSMEYIDIPAESKKRVICDEDDIIIARTGNTLGMILTNVAGVFHNNTFALDYNKKLFEKYFFYYFLKSYSVQLLIKIVSTRSGQPDLTHKEFSVLKIPIPPLKEQKQISSILSNVDSEINKEKLQQSNLELLKKGLMQKLLTGQIRVKV